MTATAVGAGSPDRREPPAPGDRADSPDAATGDPFLLLGDGGRRAFDATALERELRSLWKAPPGASAFYRAALANLVVSLDDHDGDGLSTVIGEVSRRHPARVFRVQRAGGPNPTSARLTARATALCHLREGGERNGGFVCSEQIVLEWSDACAPLLPSAIRSLLIGDLPVILLLLAPGPVHEWAQALAGKADVVIADSGGEKEPAAIAAVWNRTGRDGAPVRDLAWARLEPWRALLAELFEPPEANASLRSIREVTIAHGGTAPPSSAWLLAAWMASRLGWRLVSRDGARWRMEREGGSVDVVLVRDSNEAAPVVRAVQVRAAGGHPFDLRVEHRDHERTARVQRTAPRPTIIEMPFAYRDLAPVIVGEIQRQEPNPAFHDAASLARAMIAA